MAGKDVAQAGAVFTANGGTDGTITVASTTPFRAKARAWVSSAGGVASVEVVITQIVDATHVTVKLAKPQPESPAIGAAADQNTPQLNAPSYRLGDDMSAFTTVNTARIDMPQQFIYNEPLP